MACRPPVTTTRSSAGGGASRVNAQHAKIPVALTRYGLLLDFSRCEITSAVAASLCVIRPIPRPVGSFSYTCIARLRTVNSKHAGSATPDGPSAVGPSLTPQLRAQMLPQCRNPYSGPHSTRPAPSPGYVELRAVSFLQRLQCAMSNGHTGYTAKDSFWYTADMLAPHLSVRANLMHASPESHMDPAIVHVVLVNNSCTVPTIIPRRFSG
ncbi:hypothetical protein EK21DRAFT_87739 [Setomelanomma holmii]|uniref:Uncharacterized protein n=1 Tax=Setomelanomma holmii TaxID=210430 RepID=A0A9P4HE56_9PLEO|nr:hypothetical protein EK21DRAFT_87739 [Setomelanomma holmii]